VRTYLLNSSTWASFGWQTSVSACHCSQVIPGMVERGRGTIIFTGSSASVNGFAGYADLSKSNKFRFEHIRLWTSWKLMAHVRTPKTACRLRQVCSEGPVSVSRQGIPAGRRPHCAHDHRRCHRWPEVSENPSHHSWIPLPSKIGTLLTLMSLGTFCGQVRHFALLNKDGSRSHIYMPYSLCKV
jgi:hypothetical protein